LAQPIPDAYAATDDFAIAQAAYNAAVKRWPGARIISGKAHVWCTMAEEVRGRMVLRQVTQGVL
jgi:hypothetical protein